MINSTREMRVIFHKKYFIFDGTFSEKPPMEKWWDLMTT